MRAWHETKAACDPSDWSTAESAAYRGFFVHGFRAALQWAASQQAAEGPAAASIPEFGSKMFTGNNRAFLETFTVHVDPDLPPNEVQFRYIDRVVCRLLLDAAAPPSTQGGAE